MCGVVILASCSRKPEEISQTDEPVPTQKELSTLNTIETINPTPTNLPQVTIEPTPEIPDEKNDEAWFDMDGAEIYDFHLNPDRDSILFETSKGLFLFDAYTYTELLMYDGFQKSDSLIWSPDGDLLVVISGKSEPIINFLDVSSGQILSLDQLKNSDIQWPVTDPWISYLSRDGIYFWDTQSWEQSIRHVFFDGKALINGIEEQLEVYPLVFGWLPDKERYLVGFGSHGAQVSGNMTIWETASGDLLQVLEEAFFSPIELFFTGDGSKVAVLYEQDQIIVYDTRYYNHLLWTFSEDSSEYLSWSMDNSLLSYINETGNVEILDPGTGEFISVLTERTAPIMNTDWSPTTNLLVTGASHGAVRVWDTYYGHYMHLLSGGKLDYSRSLWLSGDEVLIVYEDNSIVVWNPYLNRIIKDRVLPTIEVEATDILAKISPIDHMVQMYIPPGEFLMGLSEAQKYNVLQTCPKWIEESQGCEKQVSREYPQRSIFLDGYWIDQIEVTYHSFIEFLNTGGDRYDYDHTINQGQEHYPYIVQTDLGWQLIYPYSLIPVTGVTWEEAQAYCEWAGKRLPTEAEWEKAARGTDGRLYPWGNSFEFRNLNYCDNWCTLEWLKADVGGDGASDISQVRVYPNGASPYGVMDMAGNVSEFVSDWFADDSYLTMPEENPIGPNNGSAHVVRGSSFFSGIWETRITYKVGGEADEDIGFRCVEPVQEE